MPKRSMEKQAQLEKYLAATLAAIDYNSARELGSFVSDGHDPLVDIFEWQREQARKCFAQRHLDRLEAKFHSQLRWVLHNADHNFAPYVEKQTGYDIDVFAKLRNDVEQILMRGIIQTQAERGDVSSLQHLLQATNTEEDRSARLEALLSEYDRKKSPSRDFVFTREHREGDFIVQEVTFISGGGSVYDYDEKRMISPDGRKRLFLSRMGRNPRGYTSIQLMFPKGSGCILQANVNNLDISAYWKNDHSIVIKTNPEIPSPIRVQLAESYGERVFIEYEEL